MNAANAFKPTAMEATLIEAARAHGAAFGGLPHARMEAWKWTDLRGALREPLAAGAGAAASASIFAGVGAYETIVADGVAVWEGAAPDGVAIARTQAQIGGDHALARLADLFGTETLELSVSPGAVVERPILIRRISGAGAAHHRTRVVIGAGASATFIETIEGEAASFGNAAIDFSIGDGARLDRIVLQEGGAGGVATMLATIALGGAARLLQRALLFGGRLARVETQISAGAGAHIDLAAAALVGGERHADATSHVAFAAAGAQARQMHRAAIAGRGRAVFQGKFHVARAGQKTDAAMRAAALLLSEQCTWNAKPELEIYADDVQCAHGASAGALDDEALFYLRQRGLDEAQARALLVEAFIGAAFDGIAHPGIEQALRQRAHRWSADNGARHDA